MRPARPIRVMLMTILLAACSPAAQVATSAPTAAPTTAATATATAAPTATPEPTIDLASAAAAYLAMSDALVLANQAAVAFLNAATSDAEASAAYQLFVDGDEVALAAFKAIDLPPDLQDEATAFIAALEKHKSVMTQLVADPQDTDPTIDERLNEAAAESRAIATAIRAALGLPPPATLPPG